MSPHDSSTLTFFMQLRHPNDFLSKKFNGVAVLVARLGSANVVGVLCTAGRALDDQLRW